MISSDPSFAVARADYARDPSYRTLLPWYRALRAARRADDLVDLVMTWQAIVEEPLQTGQLGVLCNDVGQFTEAEACLTRALPGIENLTDRFQVLKELAEAKASRGDEGGAWEIFSSLRTRSEWEAISLRLSVPGGDISGYDAYLSRLLENDLSAEGKHVLVVGEGGIGDQIWFLRYARDLLAEGAASVSWPRVPGLESAFMDSQPGLIVSDGRPFDLALRTCSLNARYQSHPYFPRHDTPYLHVADSRPASRPDGWPARRPGRDKPRVGLIWRSAGQARFEPFRSFELTDLHPILSHANVIFESLQVGGLSERERDDLARRAIIARGDQLNDFGDTAAAFGGIDLLISMCTGAAHLAGAIGLPVWVLLAKAADSRWGDHRRFTPWYRSMRLYRQDKLGDWSRPLAEMSADLAKL